MHAFLGSVSRDIADGPAAGGLLDLLSSPACLLDATGRVRQMNADWRARAGATSSAAAPPSLISVIDIADKGALEQWLEIGPAGRRLDIECRLPDPEAGPRWFMLSLHALASGSGWLCVAADIHALKLREIALERQSAMQADMLGGSVDCIKLIAPGGTLLHMNRAGCAALGVAADSGFGMPWLPLLPEEVREPGEQALAIARSGRFARFPGRSELPGGATQYWDNMLTPVAGDDGRVVSILCVSREVTVEREAQAQLRESRERLAIATRVGGLGVWDYDLAQDVMHCDEGWYAIMARDPSHPVRSIADFRPFIHPEDVAKATEVKLTASELAASGQDYAVQFRIVRPNGEIRWLRSAACLIKDEAGTPRRAIGFVLDITEAVQDEQLLRDTNRALEEERTSLVRQNLEDPLTGVANRRHLDLAFPRICSEAQESGRPICVGMVDVDHFKAFNDRYGHVKGDAALRDIATALKAACRKSDLVARYGGEEFAFILVDTDNPAPLIDRFVATVAALCIPHEGSPGGCLTVSCGCAVVDGKDALSPRSLLEQSDELLYAAKLAGRNRCMVGAAPNAPRQSEAAK